MRCGLRTVNGTPVLQDQVLMIIGRLSVHCCSTKGT
jgi:hypothetical protein